MTARRHPSNPSVWDQYVDDFGADPHHAALGWPGDEWGKPELWQNLFEVGFREDLDPTCETFVELGPGSGKYTALVLETFPSSRVFCFDVSARYLAVLGQRLAPHVRTGRVVPLLLDGDPKGLLRALAAQGVRTVDCFFSMDAMVHVDLQILVAYLLSAADLLRPEGRLLMTLANALSPDGFRKLVADVHSFYAELGAPSLQFRWLSRELVAGVLERIGFGSIEFLDERPDVISHRDLFVRARLLAPKLRVW